MDGWAWPEVLLFAEHPDRMGTLRAGLLDQGYTVALVPWGDGASTDPLIEAANVVLVQVADVSLIQLELIRELAGEEFDLHRVVVIGEGDVADRVRLLNAGADVCLPLSLSDAELTARVVAILRQAGLYGRRMTLREGQLTMDLARRAATYRGRRLSLSADEYRSLRDLALRVMESRSRFTGAGGDDRLTSALRRLSDYAESLEQNTQSMMRDQAYPRTDAPEARSAKA